MYIYFIFKMYSLSFCFITVGMRGWGRYKPSSGIPDARRSISDLYVMLVEILIAVHFQMNEWCIYIALYFVKLYTQSALQSCGGGLSSTTTSVQHPLGWCDGRHRTTAPVRSPHTSNRWRRERVIDQIKWIGFMNWIGIRKLRLTSPVRHKKAKQKGKGKKINVLTKGVMQ